MRNAVSLNGGRFINAFLWLLFIFLMVSQTLFAEGSKELSANGGSRAYLFSGSTVNSIFIFPTLGTTKVYAKAGETINVGSSVQGKGAGTINLRAPNGATYTSGSSPTVGLIANYSQEQIGPQPAAGGYVPYQVVVQPGQEGVWEVDFIPRNNGNENPLDIPANANWTQPSSQFIAAFDITVRSTANINLKGRVFTNIFSGILGAFDAGFNGIFYILTNDGYQYILDNNGQAGNGFSFFVNNKGFRRADGTPTYQSLDDLTNPDVQDPRAPDTEREITDKIFFNPPAADLPATAPTPGGGTTWLLNAFVNPGLFNPTFTGIEGTPNIAGTNPLGGAIGFNVNKNGTYTIGIDVNNNGVFTDAIDAKLAGVVSAGSNQIHWNGLDGLNNKVPPGNYTATVSVVLFGGEVHFPFIDVERNVQGIKLTRTNGPAAPNFTVYWDDSGINSTGTPSNPTQNTGGISSQANGHKWGSPGNGSSDFGDEKGLDTWSFIAATPLTASINLQVQEADLEVSNLTPDNVNGCVGQSVSYNVAVKNNGPNNVTGSKFRFNFSEGLTGVTVNYTQTTGTSKVSSGVLGAKAYTANIDLANGAVTTFTITGTTTAPLTKNDTVEVSASILRTIDMTDPDATNGDPEPPVDAEDECDSAPSGIGCNNIKSSSLIFLAQPDAGPDQSIYQKDIPTLKANTPGVWSQIGLIPAPATITTPTAVTTTITGLNDVGRYQFQRTNANGCADMVTITVLPHALDIPSVFTPNGDGKNDTFEIPNIELFPGSQLIIFNRWGNEVYHSDNYQNTWRGDGLPEGTYYYVLNKKEASGSRTPFKGWIFLKR